MRKLSLFLATALVALVPIADASARTLPPPRTLPGPAFCGFDVELSVLADNEQSTTTTLADGTTITSVTGLLVESYKNVATQKTLTRNVSGPTTTTKRPDGTATFVGTGVNRLVFGPNSRRNTGEPALVITSGRVVVEFTGNVATGFSLAGRQENVCELLASP